MCRSQSDMNHLISEFNVAELGDIALCSNKLGVV